MPITVRDANNIIQTVPTTGDKLDLIERLNREGDPIPATGRTTFTNFAVPTGAGTQFSGLPVCPVGRALYVDTVGVYSTTPIAGRLIFDNTSTWAGTGTVPSLDRAFHAGPSDSPIIPIRKFVRSSNRTGGPSALINAWLDPAVSGTNGSFSHVISLGANAWVCADSINFDAKKVILMLGDSTWNGSGPSTVLTCVPWLINKFYRDQGLDTRYILKAQSGSTSAGHETYRMGGNYEFPQVDAIFYNLGINDALQGVSVAARTANIQALIAWKRVRYPNAKLVIFGTTPVQNSTNEAQMVLFRSADAATVAAANDPNILFCSLANSYDRTVYANYSTSDPDGSAVHARDQALTPLWEGGYNGNAGLRAWLLANLPGF